MVSVAIIYTKTQYRTRNEKEYNMRIFKNKFLFLTVLSSVLFVAFQAKGIELNQPQSAVNKKEFKMINPNSAFPVLIVKDLDIAKSFYIDNFGFNIAFQNEWYLHLVSETGIQVAFMLPDQPTQPEIFRKLYNGNGLIFSLEVDDADKAYSYAKSKSLNIILDIRSEEWGQRHFALKDPNGVFVDIVQATDPTEEYKSDYETK